MTFEKLFRILSYAAVFCGFFSLWISGTFGIFGTALFLAIMAAAWFLEGSRWQISERVGTVLIVLAIPAFYLGWRFQLFGLGETGALLAGILGRLILSLTSIKLLQRKSDRDWMFLYLMSFFEMLLAAGLSISAMYLVSFVTYVFIMVCTIILFEIKKTERSTSEKFSNEKGLSAMPLKRLPAAAVVLITFIILFAGPMFFLLPRVGGAGIGGNQGGVSAGTGFSDTVRLGGIGRIQQNDETIMRVRLDNTPAQLTGLRWRGVALDTFDNQSWSRSKFTPKERREKGERDLIQIDFASDRDKLIQQTIYLEPLDTPVLFSLSRMIAVQSSFPFLLKDQYGAVTFPKSGERISYKVLSDPALPSTAELRKDNSAYPYDSAGYLQLPRSIDPRIAELARQTIQNTNNRYDAAKATESFLQSSFGYTLEQKAGGDQPVADFLFNVKEGHCEYFATAMAVMLRTQGIATRVVNGFSQGEYNEHADIYVIKQKNAHSWVEVYFPGENVWVPFDPTPFAGQEVASSAEGITAQFGQYLEALETFWIQYFVAFDNQEQRSLFTSVKRGISEYQVKATGGVSQWFDSILQWWTEVRGDKGTRTSLVAIAYGIGYLAAAAVGIILLMWLYRRLIRLKIWNRLFNWLRRKKQASVVEFYQQMQWILEGKGFIRASHQTPLEFAYELNMPEAVKITEKYNRVRFGEKYLTDEEADEITNWLDGLNNYEKGSQ